MRIFISLGRSASARWRCSSRWTCFSARTPKPSSQVTALPECISALAALKSLDLLAARPPNLDPANPMPSLVELPGSFSALTALESLGLSSRELPAVVGQLPALASLPLSLLGIVVEAAAEDGGGGDGAGGEGRSLHDQLLVLTRLSRLTSLRLHHCGPGCGA